jgi:3-oxoacyl-[acyl-carrier protein] reductase
VTTQRFKDKVVIITGASRGIGRETALSFANEGAHLILCYHEQHDAIKDLISQLPKECSHLTIAGDISQDKTIEHILSKTKEKYQKADILINNAGAIIGRFDTSSENFDLCMRTNLYGTIKLTEGFKDIARDNKSNIVNIASTFGILGAAPVALYTAAKAGVLNYTRSMAVELAPNIRVNSISPGVIDTDMTKGAGPELIEYCIKQTPLQRLGTPSDIANMALFLSSDDASFITGQNFIVDGGHILIN